MNADILIIEDNPKNRYLLRYLLESEGAKVREADSGMQGLEMARARQPDVILLDIQLPDINGLDLLPLLRAEESLAEATIIAVTSFAMPGDRERGVAAGCTEYIEKPIDPERFIARLRELLADRRPS